MAWIKKNYDRFLLGLFALVLLVSAGLLINSARGYSEGFSSLQNQPVPSSKSDVTVDNATVEAKLAKLAAPDLWKPRSLGRYQLPLFVSVPYVAKDGKAVNPLEESSEPLHPPVTNDWIMNHGLDLLAANILEQDNDGDGFTNLEEYNAKTDPTKKESHPPFYAKLFLKRFVRVPFHLRFESKINDRFFINETDNDAAATQVRKLGETVKLGRFTFKLTAYVEKFDTSHGFKKDISELTLTNVDNGQVVVLPKGEDVDSPTTYAVLSYVWNGAEIKPEPFAAKDTEIVHGPGNKPEFGVARDAEFILLPESSVRYRVIELSDTEVRVVRQTPDGKKEELRLRAQGR